MDIVERLAAAMTDARRHGHHGYAGIMWEAQAANIGLRAERDRLAAAYEASHQREMTWRDHYDRLHKSDAACVRTEVDNLKVAHAADLAQVIAERDVARLELEHLDIDYGRAVAQRDVTRADLEQAQEEGLAAARNCISLRGEMKAMKAERDATLADLNLLRKAVKEPGQAGKMQALFLAQGGTPIKSAIQIKLAEVIAMIEQAGV